jgi:hypothetical protein
MIQTVCAPKHIFILTISVMNTKLVLSLIVLSVASCKMHPLGTGSDPGENKTYRLRLNPPAGSSYHFQIRNEQRLKEEVEDKVIRNEKTTDVGAVYAFSRDSAGNIVLSLTYDQIKMRTKDGDDVTEQDAANGVNSIDPMERMLALLKAAHVVATTTTAGDINSVVGYQEVASQMLAGINTSLGEKTKAQLQWRQLVEQGIIHKNMEQFRLFPDSAVHVGDKWKIFSRETDDLTFDVKSFFTLKSIQDGLAKIETRGEIATDSTATGVMGVSVAPDLKGTQEGGYIVDIRTGMLVGAEINSEIEGTMQVAGRDVKVNIKTMVKIVGQKLQ